MTLKQKSILISLSTTLVFLAIISTVVYQVITVRFQTIENQRVERNVRRISAILDDRFTQLSSKLTDWTNWDDTYKFMQDKNEAYISSNLVPESFHNIGVDEALFIDKNGGLVTSINSVVETLGENDFPENLYSNFSTGSALLKINDGTDHNSGIIRTTDGLLLFAVREIYKSDQTGPTMGAIVFGRYLDKTVLNSVKELTQFDANMSLWDDPNLPTDYQIAKNNYLYDNKNKSLVRIFDNNTISGYSVIEDIYGKPQAIVRSDIGRDISAQGQSSMLLLMYLLISAGILVSIVNYILLTRMVLKKVSLIASDVDTIAHSGTAVNRLTIGKSADEVDKLRAEINGMLDSLYKSKAELSEEKQKGESLIDLVNAIVVTLDTSGNVLMINKDGLETLGYKKEEIVGKNWFEIIVPPSSRESLEKHFNELVTGKIIGNSHIDNEVITKSGKTLSISWHNNLVTDINGKVISTLSLGEDITIEKQEETKKENYAKELERLNELMVNRELKMIALKKEIEKYKKS